MPGRGNVLVGNVQPGKCPVGELSVRRNVRQGSVSRGTVQSGNCSHTIINVDKAHGRANIFIRMLKTFDSVTIEPIQSYLTV